MAENNLFLLFPETNPTSQYLKSNEPFQFHESVFDSFIKDFIEIVEAISIENYTGHYDSVNISDFLSHYKELEDLYPSASFSLLRETTKDWNNWRDEPQHSTTQNYSLFGQPVTIDTFCEIAERKINNADSNHPLLNHHAINHTLVINILVNNRIVDIKKLSSKAEVKEWFCRNRIPQRRFHVISKHGENRQDIRIVNDETISPLRCDRHRAQELLNIAIGKSKRELFAFDSEHNEILVFKFGNENPSNQYHGYHVSRGSTEVPEEIKEQLF